MATASESHNEPDAGDKDSGTRQAHGLPTPEPTPEPEAARLKEDEKRRQAEGQAGTANGQGSNTGSPQSSGEGSGDTTEGENRATQEQIDAVESVMKCSGTDYRQILGLQDENPNKQEELREVMVAFRKLGCLTHEKYNTVDHATEAFSRVNNAAKHLGINEAAIARMGVWDGVEDHLVLSVEDTGSEGSAAALSTGEDTEMRSNNQSVNPWLTDEHRVVYDACQPLLQLLSENPGDAHAINYLHQTNEKIKKLNTKYGFPHNQYFIEVDAIVGVYTKVQPLLEKLRKGSDQDALEQLELTNQWLQEEGTKLGFPPTWATIDIPEPANQPTARSTPIATQARSGRLPKQMIFDEKDGYVLQGGVEKELCGYMKAGYGHRVLLRQDGENGYDTFELVRASKFGKNFVERNQQVLSGTEIKTGTKPSLQGVSWKKVAILGVAPVRTDSDDEAMLMAWVRFPQRDPTWYWRSYLGTAFGTDAVDEKLDTFRRKAGQPRRAVITEDESDESDDNEEQEDRESRLQHLREEMKRLEQTTRSKGSSTTLKPRRRRTAR